MRQSQLFTKTFREAPKDEVSTNAILLTRAGYIHKAMAGVYAYLPLGLRVLNKIIQIIREEMNAIGGQELFLTTLQPPETWKKTNRWDDNVVDVWFKSRLKDGGEVGLANTHEEALTEVVTHHVASYKDLPFSAYQFQNKFRNELRARSGILRTREFIMKDLYSFSRTEAEHDAFYEKAKQAYHNVFSRVGLGDRTFITFASGGSFSKYSHEFQTLCDAGEDTMYLHREKKIAVNKEVYNDEVLKDLGVTKSELEEVKAIEVGNIFSLGTKFSDPLGPHFLDEQGEKRSAIMGSYGIGPGRLMGTIVEVSHDNKGIIWPEAVAPFKVHLVRLVAKSEDTNKKAIEAADNLYEDLTKQGIEVLYDDREEKSAGEKFADADLLGLPWRIVLSEKTLEKGGAEIKARKETAGEVVSFADVIKKLK